MITFIHETDLFLLSLPYFFGEGVKSYVKGLKVQFA